MSYEDVDYSNFSARPLLLFELEYGSSTKRYNSSDRDIEWPPGSGNNYARGNWWHEGFTRSGDAQADSITIDCPATADIVLQFRGTPPTQQIYLRVREMDFSNNTAKVAWFGTVSDVKRTSLTTAQIIGQTMSMAFKRGGLRLTYTRNCTNFIYDVLCTVNPEDFRINGVITAVGGNWFETSAAGTQINGWFDGGFMTFDRNGGVLDMYGIETHVGTRCTLLGAADRLSVGVAVAMYPGCARTSAVCDSKFHNSINYGGCSNMPGKSPFDGNPVF